jgi:hypothetical protein
VGHFSKNGAQEKGLTEMELAEQMFVIKYLWLKQ